MMASKVVMNQYCKLGQSKCYYKGLEIRTASPPLKTFWRAVDLKPPRSTSEIRRGADLRA